MELLPGRSVLTLATTAAILNLLRSESKPVQETTTSTSLLKQCTAIWLIVQVFISLVLMVLLVVNTLTGTHSSEFLFLDSSTISTIPTTMPNVTDVPLNTSEIT